MAFLESDRITSYPSTKRASVNKLITENTVTRVINRLIDKDSYVITNGLRGANFSSDIPANQWLNLKSDFEFVIHGYYFCITPDDVDGSGLAYLLRRVKLPEDADLNTEHTLYARIFIDRIDPNFPELYGQEDLVQTYQAVQFYWDSLYLTYPDGELNESNCDIYNAPLVKYMSNDAGDTFGYYVPLTSIFRFGSQAIANIDGGEVIL